jgi:hypothetical protein
MFRREAHVRTIVSEESIAFIIGATRISYLGTTLAITSSQIALGRSTISAYIFRLLVTSNVLPNTPILIILPKQKIRSSETSVFIRATLCHIPEDGILHSHYREHLKLYVNNNLSRKMAATPLR